MSFGNFRGLFTYQKASFKSFCNLWISGKLRIFFRVVLHVLCMGWEVKIDMGGQSNDCLRVCNIKIKIKNYEGRNRAHFQECLGYRAVASSDLNFLMELQVSMRLALANTFW